MKEKRLKDLRLLSTEFLTKSKETSQDISTGEPKTGDGNSRLANGGCQLPFRAETIDFGQPFVSIQAANQTNEGTLRPSRVEFGNTESDPNGMGHGLICAEEERFCCENKQLRLQVTRNCRMIEDGIPLKNGKGLQRSFHNPVVLVLNHGILEGFPRTRGL